MHYLPRAKSKLLSTSLVSIKTNTIPYHVTLSSEDIFALNITGGRDVLLLFVMHANKTAERRILSV